MGSEHGEKRRRHFSPSSDHRESECCSLFPRGKGKKSVRYATRLQSSLGREAPSLACNTEKRISHSFSSKGGKKGGKREGLVGAFTFSTAEERGVGLSLLRPRKEKRAEGRRGEDRKPSAYSLILLRPGSAGKGQKAVLVRPPKGFPYTPRGKGKKKGRKKNVERSFPRPMNNRVPSVPTRQVPHSSTKKEGE